MVDVVAPADFRNAVLQELGQAMTRLEDEIVKDSLDDLRTSMGKVTRVLQREYGGFFADLHDQIMESHISGDSPGSPAFFGEIQGNFSGQWKKLAPDWMARKNKAFDDGDHDALDFYRGITTSLVVRGKRVNPRKPLHSYTSSLADSSAPNVERFFGPMSLKFYIGHDHGVDSEIKGPTDVKSFMVQGRDEKGRFTKKLRNIRLTAEVSAFPYIAKIKADTNAPDRQIASWMATRDVGNASQWLKFRGQQNAHRPTITPLIQWYLQVQFEQILKRDLFK